MHFDTENLCDRIHLVARRYCSNHSSGPFPVFLKVIQRQRKDLIWSKPCSVFIDDAKSVRITVESQTDLSFAAAHKFSDFTHAFSIWFRVMPAKERVNLVVKYRHLRAGIL